MVLLGRFCRLVAVACVVATVTTSHMRAADSESERLTEYQVKAALLYNFVKFVQWPASNYRSDTVTIGVVGRQALTNALETMVKGKYVNGRAIAARELRIRDDPRQFHIVFIEGSESLRGIEVVRRVRKAGVLTVGETTQFLDDGGLVRLYIEADRVRFQIDPVGAQSEGLKISSQLLSLAR